MPLTTQQKTWLQSRRTQISVSFDRFKNSQAYMGVYSNRNNSQPYITFSNSNVFTPVLKMAGNTYDFVCFYICSGNFNDQTDVFLL